MTTGVPRVSYGLPRDPASEQGQTLSLTVLFTTVPATLAALREGAPLAHELGAYIRVLIPHIVPYPLPIDEPHVDPEFRVRHFRTLCEQEAIETRIDIRLCRDVSQCIHDTLRPPSLILIGARKTWWPRSYWKRLARILRKDGHEVLFVAVATDTQQNRDRDSKRSTTAIVRERICFGTARQHR